jgi:hypothetical protein
LGKITASRIGNHDKGASREQRRIVRIDAYLKQKGLLYDAGETFTKSIPENNSKNFSRERRETIDENLIWLMNNISISIVTFNECLRSYAALSPRTLDRPLETLLIY